MRQLDLGKSGFWAPEISLGCMRMKDLAVAEATKVIHAALDSGINFFDHADIYGLNGLSEEIFGKAIKELGIQREDMLLQTKCGIEISSAPGKVTAFNFSKNYIITCLEQSLTRLQVEYVDVLVLHRPDTLFEPEEVAAAFDLLHTAGKVRYFGVSNQTLGQMTLLQKHTKHKLIVNQLQFGLAHTGMIDAGLNANMKNPASVDHDGGILDHCRLHDITIQAWSPFRSAITGNAFLDDPNYFDLNATLNELAEKYQVSKEAVAATWILRHPAAMQVIIGSMNPSRIEKSAKATSFSLTRDEWYALYLSAGNILP